MIISMCKIICVTDRRSVKGSFLGQLEKIARCRPDLMILREKDLDEPEYRALAKQVGGLCNRYAVPLAVNSFYKTAAELGIKRIHLPLSILRTLTEAEKAEFDVIGASCHSADEAREAVRLGAGYLIAGHIFETACKKGLAGRGTGFLKDVCGSVCVPVYAIGGISPENAGGCIAAGAEGICMMSSLMKAENVSEYLDSLRGEIYAKGGCDTLRDNG